MKSKLAELLLQLEAMSFDDNDVYATEQILPLLTSIQEIESPYYAKVGMELGDLVRHAKVVGRLAATNMLASDPDNAMMAMLLGAVLNNDLYLALLGYTAKHFILLNLAETEAKASGERMSWTVAEQQPEAQPNQDPHSEQPDELP